MISLILPAYNPGAVLERSWCQLAAFTASQSQAWEVLVVLDGCTDDSAERLADLQTRCPNPSARVLTYQPNRGKGHAVRLGLQSARGQIRVFTDIDLAYGFEDILRVVEAVRRGAEVAIASREHPQSLVTYSVGVQGYVWRRHVQSRMFGLLARLLLPVTQRDTQAGLKAMTARVAEHLLPEMSCDGFGFDCELLTACVRSGIGVEEVPVHVRYESTASTTSRRVMLRMLRELWSIRRRWRGKSVPLPPVKPQSLPRAA